jgi:hypothetical protein
MRIATAILLAAGMVLASAASAPPLFADILRGCSAAFYVVNPNGMKLASIEGRGSCKNTARANDCRVRARKQVDACLAGMWRDRQKNAIAPECRTLTSSGREGAKLSWEGILRIAEPNRLSARMAYATCCRLRPNSTRLSAETAATFSGDKGCGSGSNKYYPAYSMDCDTWRSRGLCN